MAKGQQQQQKKKADLFVTPGEVKAVGNMFEIEFEVIATDDDGKPVAVPVTMKKDIEAGITQTTDSATGEIRFKYEVDQDKAAGKTFNIRFIRTFPSHDVRSIPIPFPEDKTVIPTTTLDWEVKHHGASGNYYITVQIKNKKNTKRKYDLWLIDVLSGAMTTVLPGNVNPLEAQTDETGFLSIHLSGFTEVKRAIHIQVKGTGLDTIVYLDGPQTLKCPRCKMPDYNGIRCDNCDFPEDRIIR